MFGVENHCILNPAMTQLYAVKFEIKIFGRMQCLSCAYSSKKMFNFLTYSITKNNRIISPYLLMFYMKSRKTRIGMDHSKSELTNSLKTPEELVQKALRYTVNLPFKWTYRTLNMSVLWPCPTLNVSVKFKVGYGHAHGEVTVWYAHLNARFTLYGKIFCYWT